MTTCLAWLAGAAVAQRTMQSIASQRQAGQNPTLERAASLRAAEAASPLACAAADSCAACSEASFFTRASSASRSSVSCL